MNGSFGPQLMLDFYSMSKELANKKFIGGVLERLVTTIGMTQLAPAVVVRSDCTNPAWIPPEATGVSGFVVLAESHISIHTFVEAEYVFMDIFSCKPFDVEVVMKFVANELNAHRLDSQLALRGMSFPLQ